MKMAIKIIGTVLISLALLQLANSFAQDTTAQVQSISGTTTLPDGQPDSVVRIAADAQGLSLVPPDQIPGCGTFWIITGAQPFPPYPFLPSRYDLATTPVFSLGPNGQFLVDATGGAVPQPTGEQALNGITSSTLLDVEGNMVLDLIARIQRTQANSSASMNGARAMDVPSPGDGGSDTNSDGGSFSPQGLPAPDYGTNLWIANFALSSVSAAGNVSNTTADISYEIQYKHDLVADTQWMSAGFILGSEVTNWTAMVLTNVSLTNNAFFRIRSWADDGSGLPIWWQLQYFGYVGVDPNADPAGDGWSNIQKFQNGMNPNVFYTPPAPQGLTAFYNANNSTAAISWQPSAGLVTGYTVQKYDAWTGQTTNYNFGTNISSFVDNVSADVPNPYSGDMLLVSYQVQAHYGSLGDSYWGGPAQLQQNTISASVVAGQQGSAYLATSALPPGTVALRVGRIDEGSYARIFRDHSYDTNFDIPVSNLTNGLYLIPPALAVTSPDGYRENIYYWYVKTVYTNGNVSAASLCSYGGSYTTADTNDDVWLAAPYFDARQQTKDNLRFLLRAATETPFTFQVVSSQYAYIVTWPTNYVYADADALGSIGDNYFYRNFVFDQNHLDANGNLTTGCYDGDYYDYYDDHGNGALIYESTLYITNTPLYDFNADGFLAVSNPAVPSSLLTATQSRWIRPQLSWDFGGTTAGGNNAYGLANLSVEDATVVNNGLVLTTYYPGNSIPDGGYRYLEAAQPQFQTVEYDFWDSSPLPGSSGFATTNKSDLLITSVGIPLSPQGGIYGPPPFQINGYAKLAVTNGNPGVYAYLGQYFTNAYKIDANGNVTTNTTGVLSPYGQFFATEPSPAALVTMPDVDTGQRGTCTVYCVSLALDANHDGNMDLSWNSPDATSPDSPFVFWCNNNFDRGHSVDGNDNEQDDLPVQYGYGPSGKYPMPDCNYTVGGNRMISCARDLEDFARLWVCGITSNLLAALPAGSTITLNWGDTWYPNSANPTIDLFVAADSDGGIGYLTNGTVALQQTNLNQCAYIGRLAPGGSIQLNTSQFANNWAGNHFIWCGVTNGTGGLTLTISDASGKVLAQASQWIQINDIKQMYERWTVGDDPASATNSTPMNVAIKATDGLLIGASAFQYTPPQNTNTPYILFVHGWNMPTWEKDRFAETAFKRLYWQGYQGRFGEFRWPTYFDFPFGEISVQALNPRNYDNSESNAWASAAGLLNKLNDLNAQYPGQVYLMAHSMGNVVAGEALRLAGTSQVVNTYIAMQAAVSAHAYDTNTPTRDFSASTPDNYAHYWTNGAPCYFNASAGAGAYVNLFNTNDWALTSSLIWPYDQNHKPDHGGFLGFGLIYPGYFYSVSSLHPNGFYVQFGSSTNSFQNLNFPGDTYAIFSYCDEAQSYALGSQANVNGTFNGNQVELDISPYSFGTQHKYHSGEFRSDNAQRAAFWNTVLVQMGLKN